MPSLVDDKTSSGSSTTDSGEDEPAEVISKSDAIEQMQAKLDVIVERQMRAATVIQCALRCKQARKVTHVQRCTKIQAAWILAKHRRILQENITAATVILQSARRSKQACKEVLRRRRALLRAKQIASVMALQKARMCKHASMLVREWRSQKDAPFRRSGNNQQYLYHSHPRDSRVQPANIGGVIWMETAREQPSKPQGNASTAKSAMPTKAALSAPFCRCMRKSGETGLITNLEDWLASKRPCKPCKQKTKPRPVKHLSHTERGVNQRLPASQPKPVVAGKGRLAITDQSKHQEVDFCGYRFVIAKLADINSIIDKRNAQTHKERVWSIVISDVDTSRDTVAVLAVTGSSLVADVLDMLQDAEVFDYSERSLASLWLAGTLLDREKKLSSCKVKDSAIISLVMNGRTKRSWTPKPGPLIWEAKGSGTGSSVERLYNNSQLQQMEAAGATQAEIQFAVAAGIAGYQCSCQHAHARGNTCEAWLPVRGVCAACNALGVEASHASCGCNCDSCQVMQTPVDYPCACTCTKHGTGCLNRVSFGPYELCDGCSYGSEFTCGCRCDPCDNNESESDGSSHTSHSPRLGDREGLCKCGAGFHGSHGCINELMTEDEKLRGECDECNTVIDTDTGEIACQCECYECETPMPDECIWAPGYPAHETWEQAPAGTSAERDHQTPVAHLPSAAVQQAAESAATLTAAINAAAQQAAETAAA